MGSPAPSTNNGDGDDAKPTTIPQPPKRDGDQDNANDGDSSSGDAEPGTAGEPITRS